MSLWIHLFVKYSGVIVWYGNTTKHDSDACNVRSQEDKRTVLFVSSGFTPFMQQPLDFHH